MHYNYCTRQLLDDFVSPIAVRENVTKYFVILPRYDN